MKLLTKDLEEKLKEYPLGSQDGKLGNSKVIAKFFNPTGVGTWYIIEGQLLENGDAEMFGYCHLGDDELAEFGTVMLSELESIQLPMGMTIERDLYIPKEIDLMQALKRDGYQVPDYIKDSYKEQINQKPEIYGHESIIICNPKADTNALKKEYKNYLKSISKNVEVDNIGLRKLAYEIKGLKEGYYLDFKYETDKNKIADRKELLNGNSFILGVSGSGKSFTAKNEMISIMLRDPNADVLIVDPEHVESKLVKALGGEVINISATSDNHINAMDMNSDYGDGANPVILKSEFILSLCEQLIGSNNLGAKQKSIIDRCTASVYRYYQQGNYQGTPPTLQDFREELLKQSEPEAKEIALAIELFTDGSLNTFAKQTNVNTDSRLICYDILDLGKQLQPIGMLVVLDSILNRITANRAKGRNTYIFIDEIYLLFQYEYSANFLFTLWKRVRKYGAYATGITQNVDDLLQSHTARTMLANSEFIVMLNQASTDRLELAKLLNISDLQMSYITNSGVGEGLIKVGSSLVPFKNKFPKNTELYKLMTTKPGENMNE